MAWNADGKQFVSSHMDGTIAYWNVDSPEGPVSTKKLHGEQGGGGRRIVCVCLLKTTIGEAQKVQKEVTIEHIALTYTVGHTHPLCRS